MNARRAVPICLSTVLSIPVKYRDQKMGAKTHETGNRESDQGVREELGALIVVDVSGFLGVIEEKRPDSDLCTNLHD